MITIVAGSPNEGAESAELDGAVGRFDYRDEVLPFVDEVLAVFRNPSVESFERIVSPAAFLPGESERSVDVLLAGPGRLVRTDEIRGVSIEEDRRFPGVDTPLDVAQILVEAEFENGDGVLVLVVTDDDGLKLAGWNVIPR